MIPLLFRGRVYGWRVVFLTRRGAMPHLLMASLVSGLEKVGRAANMGAGAAVGWQAARSLLEPKTRPPPVVAPPRKSSFGGLGGVGAVVDTSARVVSLLLMLSHLMTVVRGRGAEPAGQPSERGRGGGAAPPQEAPVAVREPEVTTVVDALERMIRTANDGVLISKLQAHKSQLQAFQSVPMELNSNILQAVMASSQSPLRPGPFNDAFGHFITVATHPIS